MKSFQKLASSLKFFVSYVKKKILNTMECFTRHVIFIDIFSFNHYNGHTQILILFQHKFNSV